MLALTAVAWSGNWIIGRAMHADIPPIALSYWRWLVACVALLVFTLPSLVAHRGTLCRQWRIVLPLAVTGVGLYQTIIYVGLNYTTSINGLLILATTPAAIVVLSWLVDGERVTRVQAFGIGVSFSGVVTIIARGSLETLATLTLNKGDIWMVAAVPFWAVYSVLLRRAPRDVPAMTLMSAMTLIGVAVLTPAYLWELSVAGPFAVTTETVSSILYVGLIASALCYVLWNRGVEIAGPNRAGLFIHLMPVSGVVLAMIFLGERLHYYHAVGVALVFAGLWLTMRRAR